MSADRLRPFALQSLNDDEVLMHCTNTPTVQFQTPVLSTGATWLCAQVSSPISVVSADLWRPQPGQMLVSEKRWRAGEIMGASLL